MSLFGKKTDGIRRAMKISYRKHVNLCIKGVLLNDDSTTTHEYGLFGALYSRNIVCGLRYDEPSIWSELMPFLDMGTEMNAIEALSNYVVYRELPLEIEAFNLDDLTGKINSSINNILKTENKRRALAYSFLQNFSWNNLISNKNKKILEKLANQMITFLQNELDLANDNKFPTDGNINYDEYGSTELHYAASEGAIEEAKILTEGGFYVDVRNIKDGRTPIFYAIEHQQDEMVYFLLEKGADVNIKDNDGYLPIYIAIIQKDFDLCDLLIEKGTYISFNNLKKLSNSNMGLLASIYLEKPDWAKYFIRGGAEVDLLLDDDGTTIAHFALSLGNIGIIELLLRYNFNFSKKTIFGITPLYFIIISDRYPKKQKADLIKLLLENGISIDIKTAFHSGGTYLHMMAYFEENDIVIAEISYDRKKIHELDSCNMTILHSASLGHNYRLVEFLIKEGARINDKDNYGRTPLLCSNEIIAVLLVNAGANVNVFDDKGLSPLLKFVSYNDIKVIELLIKRGAILNHQDKNGNSVLHYMAFKEYAYNLDILTLLINSGADLNMQNNNGDTPLHAAASYFHIKMVKYLLIEGADKTIKNKEGRYPIDETYIYKKSPAINEIQKLLDLS